MCPSFSSPPPARSAPNSASSFPPPFCFRASSPFGCVRLFPGHLPSPKGFPPPHLRHAPRHASPLRSAPLCPTYPSRDVPSRRCHDASVATRNAASLPSRAKRNAAHIHAPSSVGLSRGFHLSPYTHLSALRPSHPQLSGSSALRPPAALGHHRSPRSHPAFATASLGRHVVTFASRPRGLFARRPPPHIERRHRSLRHLLSPPRVTPLSTAVVPCPKHPLRPRWQPRLPFARAEARSERSRYSPLLFARVYATRLACAPLEPQGRVASISSSPPFFLFRCFSPLPRSTTHQRRRILPHVALLSGTPSLRLRRASSALSLPPFSWHCRTMQTPRRNAWGLPLAPASLTTVRPLSSYLPFLRPPRRFFVGLCCHAAHSAFFFLSFLPLQRETCHMASALPAGIHPFSLPLTAHLFLPLDLLFFRPLLVWLFWFLLFPFHLSRLTSPPSPPLSPPRLLRYHHLGSHSEVPFHSHRPPPFHPVDSSVDPNETNLLGWFFRVLVFRSFEAAHATPSKRWDGTLAQRPAACLGRCVCTKAVHRSRGGDDTKEIKTPTTTTFPGTFTWLCSTVVASACLSCIGAFQCILIP